MTDWRARHVGLVSGNNRECPRRTWRACPHRVPDGFAITAIKLTLVGKNLSGTPEKFIELANQAKAGYPVSKALSAPITLDVSVA